MQEYLEYKHAAMDNAYLLTSILMDDCLPRGKGIFDGGIRYLGGTLETYGNTNVADSLVAIKQLVYERKLLSLDQLRSILKADFDRYGKEWKWMQDCPKYGNDEEVADSMYRRVHEHICRVTAAQAARVGLDTYLVVIINNDANTVMGTFTGASPDGRRAFTHLNPGHNPSGGADRNGPTACLNSLVKARTDIHAGAVQNMKFSKELLQKHRPEFEALLDTYFHNGGAQLMLTVVSRGELEDAQKHPELYPNLMVRVGGFSERFVNLPRETQNEILSRTLY
jgi:pyruvate-formate lyase